MQIAFSEDSFHEMSKSILWKKNKKTVIKLSSAELAQRVMKFSLFLFYLFIYFYYIIL